jgi:hypothetical protein
MTEMTSTPRVRDRYMDEPEVQNDAQPEESSTAIAVRINELKELIAEWRGVTVDDLALERIHIAQRLNRYPIFHPQIAKTHSKKNESL